MFTSASTQVRRACDEKDDGGRERRRRELMAVCAARQRKRDGAYKRNHYIGQPKQESTIKVARWGTKVSLSGKNETKRDVCEQNSDDSAQAAALAKTTKDPKCPAEEAGRPDMLSKATSSRQSLEKASQEPQGQQNENSKATQHQEVRIDSSRAESMQQGELQHEGLGGIVAHSNFCPSDEKKNQSHIAALRDQDDAFMPRKVVPNLQPHSDLRQKSMLFTSEDASIPCKVVSNLQPKMQVQQRPTLLTSRTLEKTKVAQPQRCDSAKTRAPVPPGLVSRASCIPPPPGTWSLSEPESEPSAISETFSNVSGGRPANARGANHNKITNFKELAGMHSPEAAQPSAQYLEQAAQIPWISPWEVSGFQTCNDFEYVDDHYAGVSSCPILSTIPERPPVAHPMSWAYQGAPSSGPSSVSMYHHLL
eukprot:TRINITY_DN5432_c0_g2_i1.p1 TRINITY_DN5432_c0_g2~~TRINITY_DN5432_c0_g2_i1.p1  ORF type:complete len:422 (-),score=73.27 TRINITY_DN5432_c0_g2_i1:129-1394(-)